MALNTNTLNTNTFYLLNFDDVEDLDSPSPSPPISTSIPIPTPTRTIRPAPTATVSTTILAKNWDSAFRFGKFKEGKSCFNYHAYHLTRPHSVSTIHGVFHMQLSNGLPLPTGRSDRPSKIQEIGLNEDMRLFVKGDAIMAEEMHKVMPDLTERYVHSVSWDHVDYNTRKKWNNVKFHFRHAGLEFFKHAPIGTTMKDFFYELLYLNDIIDLTIKPVERIRGAGLFPRDSTGVHCFDAGGDVVDGKTTSSVALVKAFGGTICPEFKFTPFKKTDSHRYCARAMANIPVYIVDPQGSTSVTTVDPTYNCLTELWFPFDVNNHPTSGITKVFDHVIIPTHGDRPKSGL